MVRPSRWDKFETALLVEAYIKVTESGAQKTQVLQELSDNLRQMAINKGFEIDEIYRNLNGMMWQYTFIAKAFKKIGFGQHLPSKVFQDVVELYLYNRRTFDEILIEAKKRVNQNLAVHKLYEEQLLLEEKTMDNVIVDFSEHGKYIGTKPYQISWAGEELRKVGSWEDIYVTVVRYLYKKYPYAINRIAESFIYGESTAIVAYMADADKFTCPVKVGEQLVVDTNLTADNIVCNIKVLLDKCGTSYDDLKIYYRKFNVAERSAQYKQRIINNAFNYQKEMRIILQKRYAYGYRINSSIELNRFKKFAEMDGIVLPESDEEIKAEIRNAGYLIDDKVYVIPHEILIYFYGEFCKLYEDGNSIFFFESVFKRYQSIMEENHISSEDMLKEILKQNSDAVFAEFHDVYFAKNFISLHGRITENEAVAGEIIRCWGNALVREADSFSEELPYIPEDSIKRYLSMSHKFAWVSEGVYVLVDKLIISQEEEKDIHEYVLNACQTNGFASIGDIPLGNLIEENYELTFVGLLTAIYNKVLYEDFHLNGKILTREKSNLDVVALVKIYLEDKQTCTFDEANKKVTELTGGKYRYMAYRALYDSLVRIDKDNYVDDSMVDFDVEAIDQILSNVITDRGFIAVKEVITFVLFPVCGYAWNHYLLESYCYRFSNKYSLRCKMLNDKNSGIIAEKGISDDYDNMLAKAVARSNVPLQSEIIGKYLADTGYTAKKKFAGLESVLEIAASIRKEIK